MGTDRHPLIIQPLFSRYPTIYLRATPLALIYLRATPLSLIHLRATPLSIPIPIPGLSVRGAPLSIPSRR
jgi:hypothetical protein